MKSHRILALAMLFCSTVLFAQNRTLEGFVKYGEAPIKGVRIAIQGTQKSTLTDEKGHYSIEIAPKESSVIVGGKGLVSQYIKLKGKQTKLDVTLEFSDMDKAIAAGLIDEKTLTIAKSTLLPNENEGNMSIKSIIESKAPGVSYEEGYVFFRGNRCNLYMVDGIKVDNLESTGLDPHMIDKVEIIKDGTASVYGGGSENGVVLVTTKGNK
ncbi:MAG: carboxypeptidase-like regulatory domain-containing protein [Flavobacteriales bacterium]|nr:carboxypeptidase-like regulatory domain-containing protein [Flavobacteriales bacterium]